MYLENATKYCKPVILLFPFFFKDIKNVTNDVSLQQILKISAHLFEDEHSPFWQFFLQLFKNLVGQWQQQLVRCYGQGSPGYLGYCCRNLHIQKSCVLQAWGHSGQSSHLTMQSLKKSCKKGGVVFTVWAVTPCCWNQQSLLFCASTAINGVKDLDDFLQ